VSRRRNLNVWLGISIFLLGLTACIVRAGLLLPPGTTYYPPTGGTLVLDEQYGSNHDGLGSWVQNTGTITQNPNSITVSVSGATWSYLNLGTLQLDAYDHVIDMGLVGWNTTNWATEGCCWSGVWEINGATGTGWRTTWVMCPDSDYGTGHDVPGGVLIGKNAPATGIKVPEDTVTVLRFDGRNTPEAYRDANSNTAGTSGEWNGGNTNWLKLFTGGGVAHSNWTIAWIKIYTCVEADDPPLAEPSGPTGPDWCGDEGTVYLPADVNGPNGEPDCYVDWYDLRVIADNWLSQWDANNYQYRALPLDGGGWLQCVSGSPHNPCLVVAGVDVAGIFRSTNGGLSWTMVNDGLVNQWDHAVADVAFAPSNSNRVYAATGTAHPEDYLGHLAVSNDAGQTWTIKDTILAFGGHYGVRQQGKIIVVDPCDADHLWVGTAYTNDGVMESTDGGDSWTSRGPANVGVIYVLMADPCDPATLYAGAGADEVNDMTGQKGLWKSTNSGASWNKVYFGRVCDMAISPNRRIVICGDGDKSTVQSSTSGDSSTWSAFNTGLPADGATTYDWRAIAADPHNPGRFIIAAHTEPPGNHPKVYLKKDEFSNWTPVDSAVSTMYTTYGTPGVDGWQGLDYWFAASPSEVEFHPGVLDKMYITTWYTIDVSTDGGVNWAARNKGLRTTVADTPIWDAYEPDYVYLGYVDVGAHTGKVNRHYSHKDMSVQSILDIVGGSNATPCQFSYGPNTITLFGTSFDSNSWIYRRENHGSWALDCNNLPCGAPTASTRLTCLGAHPTSGLVFARLGNMMVIRSTDGGVTWACYSDNTVTTTQQNVGKVSPIAYDAGRNKWRVNVDGTDYEAATPGNGNWSVDPHPDWVVHPADSQLIYRVQINETGSQNELYRSTDGGATWPEPPNAIFTYGWVGKDESGLTNVTLTSDPNVLYVDWYPNWEGSSIAISTDTGDTWTPLPRIPGYHLMGIYPNPQEPTRFIFSSSGVGFWQGEVVLPGDITLFELPGWYHVDLFDFAEMAEDWLDCTDPAVPNCDP
jgi:hypothetical protein